MVKNKEHRWLAGFASAFARHDWGSLTRLARRAPAAGVSSRDLYELTLQGYLFLGFPAAIEAFGALDGVVRPAKKRPERSLPSRVKKGRQTCRRIYRDKYPALMQNLKQKSPELASWIIQEGYGKVLSRPGTTLRRRELFNVALLAASGFPKQLFAHLRALAAMEEKPHALTDLVREAAAHSAPEKRRRIKKALALFGAHPDSVWEAKVSSL